jgi:TIR domain-containing protein
MDHIFISYKSGDPDANADFIGNLKGEIRRSGFESWAFEGDLIAGDEWRPEIDQAIKTAAALVVVMTPAAKASEYVTYEWSVACGAGVPVIPLLLAQTKLHPRLEAIQYEDFTDAKRPWDALAKALHRKATSPRQAQTKEVAALCAALRDALDEPDVLMVGASARDQTPPAAKKVVEVLTHPTAQAWQDVSKVGKELHGRLMEFQQAHAEFVKSADRLSAVLRHRVRHYNAAQEIEAINDNEDLSFFLGRIHGAAPKDILPWIDRPISALSRFEKSYAAINADPDVVQVVSSHQTATNRLLAATEELKKCLL